MKKIYFNLNNSVLLTPLTGETKVTLHTTGDVLISQQTPSFSLPRKRSIILANTRCATLSRSPKGYNRTVKITLPIDQASEREFIKQIRHLFQAYEIGL